MLSVELKRDPKITSVVRTSHKKKKSKKWIITIYPVAKDENGKIAYEFGRIRSKDFDRQLDAQAAENKFIEKKLDECKRKLSLVDTMDELLDKFLEDHEKEWKPGTLSSYQDVIKNHIRPYLNNCRKIELKDKTKEFQSWLKTRVWLKNGTLQRLGVRRQNLIFSMYRAFLNYLFLNNLVEEDMTRYLGKKNIGKLQPRTTIVDPNKFGQLVQIAKEHGADYNVWRMIAFSLMTGCRRGELLGLLVEDYNPKTKRIRINKSFGRRGYEAPKTESSIRVLDVPQYLAHILDDMLDERRVGFSSEEFSKQPLFMKNGAPYPVSTFGRYLNQVFKIYEEETGERLIFHDLRRTYSTIQYEISDGNHDYMKRVMGHSSIDTTKQIYAVVTEKRKRENSQKFSDEMDELFNQ